MPTRVGCSVGSSVLIGDAVDGEAVGDVGDTVGSGGVGCEEGTKVGILDGCFDGSFDRIRVGRLDATVVGCDDGNNVGADDGTMDGRCEGVTEG